MNNWPCMCMSPSGGQFLGPHGIAVFTLALSPAPGSGHTSIIGVLTTRTGWSPLHWPHACLQRDASWVPRLSSPCHCGCWTCCTMGMGKEKPPHLGRAVKMGRERAFVLSLEAVPASTHLHVDSHSGRLHRGQRLPVVGHVLAQHLQSAVVVGMFALA